MTDRTLRALGDLDALAFDDRGLLPVVAQDAGTGRVLMLAWADREALERTLATGDAWFWSRSRGTLWRKGETSGNVLRVRTAHADCDGDTVLLLVDPAGPACHTGDTTCFGEGAEPAGAGAGAAAAPLSAPAGAEGEGAVESARRSPSSDPLDELQAVLAARARGLPEGSYTTRLLQDENLRLKKLGEETAELILAVTKGDRARVAEEAADLVYHLLVALQAAGSSLDDVREELAHRRPREGRRPPEAQR